MVLLTGTKQNSLIGTEQIPHDNKVQKLSNVNPENIYFFDLTIATCQYQ